MKKIVPLLLCSLLLVGCGTAVSDGADSGTTTDSAAPAPESECEISFSNEYRQISMEEAIEIMNAETGYLIVDVRTHEEFSEAHIPGAICIPNETIGCTPPAELQDKDQLLLIYCRSGNRSKQAAGKLAGLGYTNVVEFGGIIDWPGETVGRS